MKHLFSLVFMLFIITSVSAQVASNADIVLQLNGDELTGKVTEIGDSTIKFTHQGETLVYSIKKRDILKITYASGRIEFFNKSPMQATETAAANSTNGNTLSPAGNLSDHYNKVAVLPFNYLIDKRDAGEEMTYKVQNEVFSFLGKHTGSLQLQDPNTTNALLIKAGVANSNIRGFTMGEICNILGVEYVLQGTITLDKTTASSILSSTGSYKDKSGQYDKNGNQIGSVFSGNSSSTSVATVVQNYKTSVTMNLFNDKGQSTFSQNHDAFWNTEDAYKITLQYLLKKTPIYQK